MPFTDYMGYEPELERWRRRRPPLEELLSMPAEVAPALPAARTTVPQPPIAPAPGEPLPAPNLGPAPAPLSRLEQLLNERNAIAAAHPSAPVTQLPGGQRAIGAVEKPSRLKQAGMGALQGIINAGPSGDPWKVLGAAGTGAAIGAVSPKMVQALSRAQLVDELDRNLATTQQAELGNARINETNAQAEQRRLEPVLRAAQIQRQIDEDKAQETDRATRSKQADEANKVRIRGIEERERHNRVMETKTKERADQYRVDSTTGDIIAIDPDTNNTTVIRKGSKQHGAAAQAKAIWDAAGKQYDTDAKPKWAEADRLREEAERLSADRVSAKQNEGRIKDLTRQADRLDKEAEGIANKVRTMQVEGDKLAASAAAAGGGDDTEDRLRAAATAKGLDPDEAVRRYRARKNRK
jgi:hypothetical protein